MVILTELLTRLSSLIWGLPTLFVFFFVHLFFTFKTGFIQRKLFLGIKLSLARGDGEISSFKALSLALASTMGTGNIIGVGTTIALGGFGAVFWCWLTGVFSMATKYAETFITVKYRETDGQKSFGGAMYVLKNKLNCKALSVFFAIFTFLCSFGIGALVQANAAFTVLSESVSLSGVSFGIVFAVLTALVIFGGVKSISSVCEALVPSVSVLYIIGCFFILFYNRAYILSALSLIVSDAFGLKSAAVGITSGMLMNSLRFGVSRGLFTNEAGMGSSPMISCACDENNPVKAALVAQTTVFWDTVVVCLITALCMTTHILRFSLTKADIADGGLLAYRCFSQLPYCGGFILVFSIIVFAFATVIGWSYYGECAFSFLFGEKRIPIFKALWVGAVFASPFIPLEAVWLLSDILNAFMTFPNIYMILKLSNEIKRTEKFYGYSKTKGNS